jgi:hypothetical protein
VALAQLQGEASEADAVLHRLAEEAEGRYWLGDALEARYAMLRIDERNRRKDVQVARPELETVARQHGFNWLLTRMAVPVTAR